MTSFPSIFSQFTLNRQPRKQGGIFALSLGNRVHLSKSQQIKQQSQQKVPKNKFITYSLPKQPPPQTNRYNKSLFTNNRSFLAEEYVEKGHKSLFAVTPDSLIVSSQSPEEIDNVGAIKTRLLTNCQLIQVLLTQDKQSLQQICQSLTKLRSTILTELQQVQKCFNSNLSKLKKHLSCLRRETGSETKVNRLQKEELEGQFQIFQQVFNKNKQTLDYLEDNIKID